MGTDTYDSPFLYSGFYCLLCGLCRVVIAVTVAVGHTRSGLPSLWLVLVRILCCMTIHLTMSCVSVPFSFGVGYRIFLFDSAKGWEYVGEVVNMFKFFLSSGEGRENSMDYM